jgi:catechol 1,2-dioxygenase
MANRQDLRLAAVFDDVVASLKQVIRKRRVTHEEYRRAVAFMCEVAASGEVPLLMDDFLEATVVDNSDKAGTELSVEGPYYLEGAPILAAPYVLPQRSDEPGEILVLSGVVRSTDGLALGGATIDIWQSDARGAYSHFNYAEPKYNLRGKLRADAQGRFEVRTVIPSPYEIPKQGPTGSLLNMMGRHAFRPAHIHTQLSAPGFETLTTQLYFAGDPWLDSDVVGAVKDSLVITPVHQDDPADVQNRGFGRPYYSAEYDFALRPQTREFEVSMAAHSRTGAS